MLDLAAQHALGSENAVSVYLGDGAGGFGLSASVTVGVHPTVIAADLDGNGTLDLATANRDDANVSVVLGNGNGTFAAAVDYSVGPMPTMNPASIGAADLDRDGILDLVTSDSGWDALSVLRGTVAGPSRPRLWSTSPLVPGPRRWSSAISTATERSTWSSPTPGNPARRFCSETGWAASVSRRPSPWAQCRETSASRTSTATESWT